MNELSNLIKEAKPLYFERKRIKKRIQRICLSLFMVFTVLASGYSGYAIKSMNNDYIASSEINITESFFPLDDDGLITVAYWKI